MPEWQRLTSAVRNAHEREHSAAQMNKKSLAAPAKFFSRLFWPGVAAVSTLTAACGLWHIVAAQTEYANSKNTYEAIACYASSAAEDATAVIPKESAMTAAAPEEEAPVLGDPYAGTVFPEVDFTGLLAQNEDVVGWIEIPDTHVNYPVVQGEDNVYYLNHMVSGEANGSGSIFLDAGCTEGFAGKHAILYGHNMKNKTMFCDLLLYKDQAYYDEHPVYRLMTPEANFVVEIFSVAPVSVYQDGWRTEFENDEDFAQWLSACAARSAVQTGAVPTASDRVLTLSTCTYEFDNARLLVCGILHEVQGGAVNSANQRKR